MKAAQWPGGVELLHVVWHVVIEKFHWAAKFLRAEVSCLSGVEWSGMEWRGVEWNGLGFHA